MQAALLNRCMNDEDQLMAYQRGDLLFVTNLHPYKSYTSYGILVDKGSYSVVLNSDSTAFGGFGNINERLEYRTHKGMDKNQDLEWLNLYLPSRTTIVLKKKSL